MCVVVRPLYSADFLLSHRSRDGKSDDPPDWNFLQTTYLERAHQAIQFILCRSPIALNPLANETKPRERDPR